MEILSVPSLASLSTNIGTSASSATKIALILCGTALAIGLVVVVYKLAQGSSGAREILIGWLVAVLVYGLAVTHILTT